MHIAVHRDATARRSGHSMTHGAKAPYLVGLKVIPEAVAGTSYPFHLPSIRGLDLRFSRPVTFFVGENGTGKSTTIEALAEICGLPASGGGRSEFAAAHGPEPEAALTTALRPAFRKRPRDAYFFRAEFQSHFASLLDQRRRDPDFIGGDPYARYGGRSLYTRSHGEAFLAVFQERIGEGLYLFDEPESALSPQRQLTLLAHMATRFTRSGWKTRRTTRSPAASSSRPRATGSISSRARMTTDEAQARRTVLPARRAGRAHGREGTISLARNVPPRGRRA